MRRVVHGSGIVVIAVMSAALLGTPVLWDIGPGGLAVKVWATDSSSNEAVPGRLPDSLEGDPEAIALGERIFHTYCWGCHSRNGTGAQCPDFSDDRQIHGDGYADLVNVVTNGVKGTPMGPWAYALGRKRLLQVVAYVFSLKGTRQAHR